MGLNEDRLKRLRDKWVLCPICRTSSGNFAIKGLHDDTLVCRSCKSEWWIQFSGPPHRQDEPSRAKLRKEKGVNVERSWLLIEGWITREMKDYERSQMAKGLAPYEGKWIPQEERNKKELEREEKARSSVAEWLKLFREMEREERKRGMFDLAEHSRQWVECPRCGKIHSSRWPECPFCRAREIRDAEDRGRLH